jgi:FkbM family methyltransferase
MSKTLDGIGADLSLWKQHHSIVIHKEEYLTDQNEDIIFTIRDLKNKDFHLISFANTELSVAKNIALNVCIKKTQECTTNFTIYLTGGVCIAIIDLDNLQVLSGLAKEQSSFKLTPKEDGWTEVIINITLEKESPIYLGCSLGTESIYEGFDRKQFYIQNSIFIDVLEYHNLSLRYPAINEINEFNIVDIGSAKGIQTHWESFLFSSLKNKFNFFLFEPSRKDAEELREWYKDFSNVKVLEYALGDVNKNDIINITNFDQCSSVREPNMTILQKYNVSPCFQVKEQIKVDFYRYDHLFQKGLVSQPDFVKIDVQGFEYEVIEGFGSVIEQCIGIELEAHFYEIYKGQKLLGDVVNLLLKHDLYLRDIRPQWSFDSDLVEVNAFFTKNPNKLSEVSKNKLKLIDSVFNLKNSEVGKWLANKYKI